MYGVYKVSRMEEGKAVNECGGELCCFCLVLMFRVEVPVHGPCETNAYAGAPALSRAAYRPTAPHQPKSLNGKIHNPMSALHKSSFSQCSMKLIR